MKFPLEPKLQPHEIRDLLASHDVQESMPIEGEPCSPALRNYLALTYRAGLISEDMEFNDIELLYSRYYWYLKAVRLWQSEHGCDAGMEQQAFHLLEVCGEELDWDVIQEIEKRVATELDMETGQQPTE